MTEAAKVALEKARVQGRALMEKMRATPPAAVAILNGRARQHTATTVTNVAAQFDGLRRTRSGAWTVHGRRYRTKALAMRAWKSRTPRSITSSIVNAVAPFAWDLLQRGIVHLAQTRESR